MYRVQVIADNSGKWVGNGLFFDTVQDAQDYAGGLFMRWTAVRDWRVIDENEQEISHFDGQAG